MLFNSYIFIFIFLPIMFVGYFTLTSYRKIKLSKIYLVIGSLFFYSYWSPVYLPLILFSIIVNFILGRKLSEISDSLNLSKRKKILRLSIILNLSLLGYFKYTDFLIGNINSIFDVNIPLFNIVLPLAISFFTFQQIGYIVDSYHGKTKHYSLANYTLFVTFFPQLIAGPIVHHADMMPQFEKNCNLNINYDNISKGIYIFFIGLFKKVVIADTFSLWATSGFDTSVNLNFFEAWATSLSYTFQLYFDFSGYVDMAIGVALLFNIILPINFNSPYKAQNIQDFWRRWHITLSNFLKNYLYIPLGGNRVSSGRIYLNLFITFLLGGLWHGASWMFVTWGALHGVGLIVHRVWQLRNGKLNKYLAWFITFNFVNIAWVFFRAKDITSAMKVLKGMFDITNIVFPLKLNDYFNNLHVLNIKLGPWLENLSPSSSAELVLFIIISFFIIYQKNTNEIQFLLSRKKLLYLCSLATISLYLMIFVETDFLYFNF